MRNIYMEVLRDLNGKQSRKVAHNTYLQVRDAETLALKYHATDVVLYHSDGRVVLDTGGWKTSTTKLRFNESYARLPLRVFANKGVWYVCKPGDWDNAVPFDDGLTLSPDKEGLYHVDPKTVGEDPKKTQKLRARVKRYAAAFIAKMRAGEIPRPGPGDCFFCQMREVKTGKPLGEIARPADHILTHMSERYYVPSLLYRALEVGPASQVMKWCVGSKWDMLQGSTYEGHDYEWQALTKMLSKYILSQIGEVR